MLDVQNEKTASSESALPSPATASSPSKQKLSATAIIPIWIVLSSSVIIYNNYLYNTLQFRFPVFLVTFHLTFAVSYLLLFTIVTMGHAGGLSIERFLRIMKPGPVCLGTLRTSRDISDHRSTTSCLTNSPSISST